MPLGGGGGTRVKRAQKEMFVYGRLKCLMEQNTVNSSIILYPFYGLGVRLSIYVA
jgi:hypothetical protein